MKLIVYKGFNISFLDKLDGTPLVNNDIQSKINILECKKKTKKALDRALLDLTDNDTAWITYREYTIIKSRVDDAVKEDGLSLSIFLNNLYPDYYPIEFDISDQLAMQIERCLNGTVTEPESVECERYLQVYNTLVHIDNMYFGSFYNYEYEKADNTSITKYYPSGHISEDQNNTDFNIYLNEDVDSYLRDLNDIKERGAKIIGLQSTNGEVSKRTQASLLAYCKQYKIKVERYHDCLVDDDKQESELIRIAQDDIKINGFKGFRTISFYRNPDLDKEVIEISQSQIIREILHQAENAYSNEHNYRDISVANPLMPLGHLLDQWEVYKQYNGLAKIKREVFVDDVI